jgi:DNA repair protein RadC
MTADITRAALMMGITVHDHIIIGKGKWLSFRAEKLL